MSDDVKGTLISICMKQCPCGCGARSPVCSLHSSVLASAGLVAGDPDRASAVLKSHRVASSRRKLVGGREMCLKREKVIFQQQRQKVANSIITRE